MARAKGPRTSGDITQKMVEKALAQGWDVDYSPGGHICFKSPDKRVGPIYTASTPSDKRAGRNLRAQLRRAGLTGA